MRSNIEKASSIKMLMPCYKDLVMLAVNGVRSERQLSKWLVLLSKLMFHQLSVMSLWWRKQKFLKISKVDQNCLRLVLNISQPIS